MYYYLRGKIVGVNEETCIIDVNGVGYEFLTISNTDFNMGDEVVVYTLHIVREDDEILVGFKDLKEKDVFNKLLQVKGIGPKTAVTAIKGTTIDNFILMINTNDLKSLKKLPGIGPKAAAQIILDMKGKIAESKLEEVDSKTSSKKLNSEQEAAKTVLLNLGFKAKEIEEAFSKLPDVLTASQYVNEVLKRKGNA